MNNVIGAPAPAWLRIVAALGLIWNLFGVYAYLQTVGMLRRRRPEHVGRARCPPGSPAPSPIAVFGGALGCLALLMLKRLVDLAAADLAPRRAGAGSLGLCAGTGGAAESPVLPLLVNVIAILLVWLAYHADKKGWLS